MERHMHDHHRHMMDDFKRRLIVSLALTAPVLILSPLVQSLLGFEFSFENSDHVLLALSAAIYVYGGYPFLKGMARELAQRKPGMMTLIGIATSVAFIYSAAVVLGIPGKFFFWELATLITVMLFGHWMEMRSVLSASRALEKLAELLPATAHLVRGGSLVDTPLSRLKEGDLVLVKPGERMPADGMVLEGTSSADESMMTGESAPVPKRKGSSVIGGSVNGDGPLTLEIRRTGKGTYLSQMIALVRKAQASRSRMQGLADRASMWLTFIGLGAGIVTLAYWLGVEDFAFALERAVTVLVITCPHALGLAIPLVVAFSTSLAAANGFLIRNRTAFENARRIDTVVFDKTGTLTEGRFSVSEVRPLRKGIGVERVLSLAASLERGSEHPIGKAIVEEAGRKGLKPIKARSSKAIPGKGMRGMVGRSDVIIASPSYARELGFEAQGGEGTTVYVVADGRPAGIILLEDSIREESFDAIQRLRSMGVECMMLTGDSEEVAKDVAEKLVLADHFSELLPKQKVDAIRDLKGDGRTVAMVGDGINDAPALVEADLGIAIGAGTDVAVESADVVLVRDDPRDIADIIRLSRATYGKMLQNLGWATGYNALAIPLAAGVLFSHGIVLSPAIGALLMSASTVIVAINAKLLKM